MRPFEAVQMYFHQAADQLELADNIRTLLIRARREVQVQIPVEMDNGELHSFIGYRVQHNRARGRDDQRRHLLGDQTMRHGDDLREGKIEFEADARGEIESIARARRHPKKARTKTEE